MCGFNPRISAWSIAVPMCPPACTDLRAETPLRTARVDRQSHINVGRVSCSREAAVCWMRLLGRHATGDAMAPNQQLGSAPLAVQQG